MKKSKFFTNLIQTGQFSVGEDGRVLLMGEYLLLIPPLVMIKLRENIEKEIGKEKTKKIFQYIGSFHIKQALERYKERYKIQNYDKRKLLEFVMDSANILGYGKIVIKKISFKEKICDVIVENSTIAEKYKTIKNNLSEPVDDYICGMIKEGTSAFFGVEMEVNEIKCLAKGDPYCEFIAVPKS
ncbi:MAG: hypothetical protein QXL86_00545 [Candidatus Aenigmatarchaeota archaeon]